MSLELLTNLKDFEKLLKICRKQGVIDLAFGEVSLKLGDLPSKSEQDESEEIPTDGPTMDELIYHAVGGPQ